MKNCLAAGALPVLQWSIRPAARTSPCHRSIIGAIIEHRRAAKASPVMQWSTIVVAMKHRRAARASPAMQWSVSGPSKHHRRYNEASSLLRWSIVGPSEHHRCCNGGSLGRRFTAEAFPPLQMEHHMCFKELHVQHGEERMMRWWLEALRRDMGLVG